MYRSPSDRLLNALLPLLAIAAAAVVVLIVWFLWAESWPLLAPVWQSLTGTAAEQNSAPGLLNSSSWHPSEGQYHLWPMVLGTLVTALGAVLLAAPLGIGSAIFCRFYAPPAVARGYRWVLELMAGIPSVVYGFWGLVVLVPLIAQWQGPGTSVLAGILVLTLMILPTAALLAEATLEKTPAHWINGAYALGLNRWAMLRHLALPWSFAGLSNALMLQTARALGETMAVLMVCGNIPQIPDSLFQPVRTLSANIALEMAYALDFHRVALYVSGLLLLITVLLLVITANRLQREQSHV